MMTNVNPPEPVPNGVRWSTAFQHLVTLLTTLVASYFIFAGNQENTQAQMLESAFKRMDSQEVIITQLRTELVQTQLRLIELEAELNDNVTRAELLQNYLNYLPFPAWIKRQRKDGKFEMVMINEAYTSEYGITATRYVGKTDYDVHSFELAQRYEENDLRVLSTDGPIRTSESVRVNDIEIPIEVFKFAMPISNNEYGVGGVAISRHRTGK